MFLNLVLLIVYIINLPNDLLYLFLLLISCVTHHLVLFIMIFGVLLLLRQSLLIVISCYLLMITLVLLGFIFLKCILLCPKFILVLQTWFVLSVLKFIKILYTDNAMEYKDSHLFSFLFHQGTLVQLSCPYTSPQNGRGERKHCHILDYIHVEPLSLPLNLRSLG